VQAARRHRGRARVGRAQVERQREAARDGVSDRANGGGDTFPPPLWHEDGRQERDRRRRKQRVHRREREPVDVGTRDHLKPCATSAWARSSRKEWPLIAAGPAESASREAIRGTTTPNSAGRRSSAASDTAGPTSRWRTAE